MKNIKSVGNYDTQDIIEKIINKKLTRENDEKYSGGLWDLAGEIADKVKDLSPNEFDILQEQIYYAFWNITDNFLNYIKN